MVLAEVERRTGYFQRAHPALANARAVVTERGDQLWLPAVLRATGNLAASQTPPDLLLAEQLFRESLATARKLGAKSLELQAAISLAQLWLGQGKSERARSLLAPVLGWFTEGFHTPDLTEAKALLEQLA